MQPQQTSQAFGSEAGVPEMAHSYQPTTQAVAPSVELSIIVPTFNEQANVVELVHRLEACLAHVAWEVIFVDDDSPDGTANLVHKIGRLDRRVRCLQRLGRRGLASACIEGMLSSSAPYLAVIDGDLQHDETLLPQMLEFLKKEDTDIVVGSRYVSGGRLGDWNQRRAAISRFATRLSRLVLRAELADPMSGFFMIRREAFHLVVRKLSGIGFKILVDIFASSPQPLHFKELPYQFRLRHAGESKLDNQATWDYLMLLLDKLIGHIIPVRFIAFTLVGVFGVFLHLLILSLMLHGLQIGFITSQSIATLIAITNNFVLNNILTYRDMRLRGWQWLRGWLLFTLVCGFGALANVGIASYLFEMNTFWVLSAFAGIIVGAVWNYAVTAVYTWKKPKSA
jgi:dolichol-phosphate mannosyltransferase